jgi:hypothetical protein
MPGKSSINPSTQYSAVQTQSTSRYEVSICICVDTHAVPMRCLGTSSFRCWRVPIISRAFRHYCTLEKKSKLEELCDLYTDNRNDVRHYRVCRPTKTPTCGRIPCENRVPNSRTLCVVRVLCYTSYDMGTRDDTEKCNVFVH